MNKHLIAQIYGYLICLVAIITFLVAAGFIISELIDRTDPLIATGYYYGSQQPSLASFENYKTDILRSMTGADASRSQYIPDDKTLHEMYDAAKNDKIHKELHHIKKSIASDCMLIVLSVAFFMIHWRWVRRLRLSE
jgi:predicted PurR-regulated permease PerM